MLRNPFKSEADAFQLVLLALGYFGLIVVATAINRWVGLVVFVFLTAGAIAWIVRARREPPTRRAPIRRSAPGERRILVIANETVGGETLREEIRRVQTQLGITTLYVTHDQEEALSISDRVAVM